MRYYFLEVERWRAVSDELR